MASGSIFKKVGNDSGSSESAADFRGGGPGAAAAGNAPVECSGWVYHLGVNSIGHEYCRQRFLVIRGMFVEMYKRDPHESPGAKPVRRGTIGNSFVVEGLGQRRVNHGDVYVVRFYNQLDETKKGEIACATAAEAKKWMEAFDNARQQVEADLSSGDVATHKLNAESEISLDGHRPRVRRYANGLKELIKRGPGPEKLLRISSTSSIESRSELYYDALGGDPADAREWKCVRTINGVRIFEDVAEAKNGKIVLVKAVGVVEASAETVLDIVLNLDRHQRYEWDTLTGDLELVASLNGHYDIVYGTFEPRHLTWWQSKRDFVFSRQWFHGEDGTYTILQFPAVHKNRAPKSGYRRTKINSSTWEIRDLSTSSKSAKCLMTQMVEIRSKNWFKWKKNDFSEFEKTIPFGLLSQVAGLKEYIGANPGRIRELSGVIFRSKKSDDFEQNRQLEGAEGVDLFYDAIASDSSSSEEDSDDEVEPNNKEKVVKPKKASWAVARLALSRTAAGTSVGKESTPNSPTTPVITNFLGTMQQGKDDNDINCWTAPGGSGFVIRGKTYLKDSTKVKGGDPMFKLIAVDWYKIENNLTKVALHPKCLVQSEVAKKIPFIFIINLMVPAKPNYSLVLYFAADKPVTKDTLLDKFRDGTDTFRDSRFKLIPSIIEGHWMVKRAVGTKACLLGKAVKCYYLREDNFLEIDVDIGSSSVARSVIGLVLGYAASLVVDLAILLEGKEESELPEEILGTVRLNRVTVDSAVQLDNV
ncbi:PREDICTED: protein ENHANCED DISEASE RESISTANCE 2-like isoform X1 [Ipomoea nil]|uniref:protein ENHANCED DISEASE RESISTANCE 2-like isoform X1 n=2 Tax=Ipomoea nil TaxID=35883 RepID=UPI000901404C|nr:PREDICTED: protein ENHANCED DISEASE RESISTANCE 2-like isoform X1 [Ipomoea nil]